MMPWTEIRRLKRSECAVLHLGLKSHWYRLIYSGVKKVEFREATPYWDVRVANWQSKIQEGKTPVLEFQNGYGRFSPRMAFMCGIGGNDIGLFYTKREADDPVQHKELGEFPKKRYVFFIGERVVLLKEQFPEKSAHALYQR